MRSFLVLASLAIILLFGISQNVWAPKLSPYDTEWITYHAPDEYGSTKPHELFNIQYRITNGIIESFEQIDQAFFKVELSSKNDSIFEIKIPKNYPYSNVPIEERRGGENPIMIISDGKEVTSGYKMKETNCFYVHSISFSGNKTFELGYPHLLVGLPFLGDEVPQHCINETIFLDSPLKQFKSGIPAQAIMCKQGLQSIMKINDGSPACVKPSTASRLIELGWGEPTIIIEKGWIDRSK